jgi:hypothetical protein
MVNYYQRRPIIMVREKKMIHKVQMTDGKKALIHQLLQEYEIESAEDIQDALKDLLGGTIKEMLEAEMVTTWVMNGQLVRIATMHEMDISQRKSIVAMEVLKLMSLRIDYLLLHHRLSKRDRKISLVSNRRLSLCMRRE